MTDLNETKEATSVVAFTIGRNGIDEAIEHLSDLTYDLPLPRNGRLAGDPTPDDLLKMKVSAHMNAARECLRVAERLAYQAGDELADKGLGYTSDDVRMFLDSTCESLIDLGGCVYGLP